MRGNILLDSLPTEVFERLAPSFEKINLPTDRNIFNDGDRLDYVYFPLNSIFHLFMTMESGVTVESGIIGNEGVVGLPAFFGAENFFNHARILAANQALRIKTQIIKNEFDKGGLLNRLILRYAHSFLVQISQTAACNRVHPMEARVCRWLLLMCNQTGSGKLAVTQEFIARMLCSQRPYVTTALGLLQKQNIVSCARGVIEILNHKALETYACECYPIIREQLNCLKSHRLS